ncbi:hypothetical protein [Singulisphaera sp. PoT]|uniref:hypothetical protein n=1 Tax=Singulisphaera sp. PoT TaxID=3411797 RepID=UPI003BF5A1F1
MIATQAVETLAPRSTKRGRPRSASIRAHRKNHIKLAGLMLLTDFSVNRIAALFGISRSTAYVWFDLGISYDDPESVELRRIFDNSN